MRPLSWRATPRQTLRICPPCWSRSWQVRLIIRRVIDLSHARRGRKSLGFATSAIVFLSMLTKIASGYWHVADLQTGYTVASLKVLQTLDLDAIYKRYGMPNDMLVKLNVYNFRVRDVLVRPVYGVGELSGIRPISMIPRLTIFLLRLFGYRMLEKYVIRDFHPLVIFYATGIIWLLLGLVFGFYVVGYRLFMGSIHAIPYYFPRSLRSWVGIP